jgi:hypothetical protein
MPDSTQQTPTNDAAPIRAPLAGAVDDDKEPFIDRFYDEINKVIGGDNKNQFLCLSLPGTLLAPESFRFDYKNDAPKPPKVEANESRLVNKLFDACHISVGDSGRTLPQQYKSALDMLTPKLNAKIAEAKNLLRRMLMTPYSYDFGKGLVTGLTLQQVFYRLYDEWIEKKQTWVKMEIDKQTELRVKYPDTSAESNEKYQDEYLNWYQTVAEGFLEGLNEHMGKILGVFSPNDMKIIEGILDSGSGAELEEAREVLNNARRSNPDGGYTYPVTLHPENWFDLLDNSFSGIDLLETPAALTQQLATLETQRLNLVTQVNRLAAAIPDDAEVQKAKSAVSEAQVALNTCEASLVQNYGEGAATVFRTALSLAKVFGGAGGIIPGTLLSRLASDCGITAMDGFLKGLQAQLSSGFDRQTALIGSAKTLTDAMMKSKELDTQSALKPLIQPLQTKLDDVNAKIAGLQARIKLANAVQTTPKDQDGKEVASSGAKEAIMPIEIPKGFMQIVMEVSASSMQTATQKSSQASESTFGANFFFCGGSHSSSSSSSAYDSFTSDADCKLQIGMSVAKVSIDRAWFNPGLFLLSRDMCNVTTQKFAPDSDYSAGYTISPEVSKQAVEARFEKMNDCVFPCFPTAFVVARDVTIRLVSTKNFSDEHARAMESHASSGGGFLFFSGHSSSSSSSSSSAASAQSSGNSVTIRFADPQVIGYYLEATSPDKSRYIDDVSRDQNAGYVTIIDFVQKCKEMLDEYNKFLSEQKH